MSSILQINPCRSWVAPGMPSQHPFMGRSFVTKCCQYVPNGVNAVHFLWIVATCCFRCIVCVCRCSQLLNSGSNFRVQFTTHWNQLAGWLQPVRSVWSHCLLFPLLCSWLGFHFEMSLAHRTVMVPVHLAERNCSCRQFGMRWLSLWSQQRLGSILMGMWMSTWWSIGTKIWSLMVKCGQSLISFH